METRSRDEQIKLQIPAPLVLLTIWAEREDELLESTSVSTTRKGLSGYFNFALGADEKRIQQRYSNIESKMRSI
jgi:hypothetical protein